MDYSSEVRRRFDSAVRESCASGADRLVTGEAEDCTLNLWVRFQLEIAEGTVAKAWFEVFGCPHAIAAASWVADWIEGRPVAAIRELNIHEAARELEIPVAKMGKLIRIEDAVMACVETARGADK
jgi:NifU-like protein involved in Fe-S cluster formation